MESKKLIPLSIVAAGIIAGIGLYAGNAPKEPEQSIERVSQITSIQPITAEDHIRGNPNAELILIEYSDFECPFCKDFHSTLQALMERYGQEGELAWVYRHFPLDSLHRQARPEAHASECVASIGGNDAFWTFADTIFKETPSNDGLDLSTLPTLAERAGIDQTEFTTCHESGQYLDAIEADFNDALETGAVGTPHLVFVTRGGDIFSPDSGAIDIETLQMIVDLLLESSRNNQDPRLTRNQLTQLLGY